jgi:26S proteasome regulatory subunit N11
VVSQALEEDSKLTDEQRALKHVGKQDPKRHLEEKVTVLLSTNITQCLGAMLNTVVFQ